MPNSRPVVVFIDDDSMERDVVTARLGGRGYEVKTFAQNNDLFKKLKDMEDQKIMPDAIVVKFPHEPLDGIALVADLNDRYPATPVIAFSGAPAAAKEFDEIGFDAKKARFVRTVDGIEPSQVFEAVDDVTRHLSAAAPERGRSGGREA